MASAKVRVLLVDDRPENLLSLEAILSSPDYELIKAGSGADALRYLLSSDCAIILLDVQMPGMDGFETADLIKNNPKLKDIPIIFLTALNTDQRYVARGYRAGAVDYISKPIVAEYLQTKVAVFAQLHRARLMVVEQAWQLREHEKREQERRRAELELHALRREQALQRRYRDLVEGIPRAIVWVAEPVSLVLSFVSAGAFALTGSWDATLPDQLGRIVHPDDRAAFEGRLRKLTPDVAETLSHRLLKSDGATIWLSTTVRLEKKLERSEQQQAADGVEIRGFSVDVTEAKQVERMLRLLARVSERVGSTLDPTEIAERLTSVCVPEIADGCMVTIDAGDADDGRSVFAGARSEAWSTSPPLDEEPLVVPLCVDGMKVGTLALWLARPVDQQGLLLADEIARRAGQALHNARLYTRVRDAVGHRDEFLSVASHELRTPLTALKMGLQNSLGRLQVATTTTTTTVTAAVVHSLAVADRQVDRLLLVVDQLLDVSRIRAGRLELDRAEVDLRSLVSDVVARFQPELERKQVQLSQDLHSVVGDWDRSRLDQVISNLISNAIKYGQGKPVDVAVRLERQRACLIVGDRGIGVAASDVDRIFDRFERAASAQSFSGLGLGLYIARQIVLAHGGDIRVESNAGEGARFFVELPVSHANA
jgi:signal transduction histidine kinase/CheY-like chemotaxis protein